MKKLFIALFAITTLVVTSCKKESGVAPIKSSKTVKTFDKSVVGSWD